MNYQELSDAIILDLKPFFEKNLKESPVFKVKKMVSSLTGYWSHTVIDVNTEQGDTIFSFIVKHNIRIEDKLICAVVLNVYIEKHKPLYNKFLKYNYKRSNDSFSLFINYAKNKSDDLKIIEKISILPYSKKSREVINQRIHAKITTPFEVVDVYSMPKFFFENGRLYLHDTFYFTSYGLDFSFSNVSENDDQFINQAIKSFSDNFYEFHRTNIVGEISKLYNIPYSEVDSFSYEQIRSYYPVLAIEHY
jgi:hypothetical protein